MLRKTVEGFEQEYYVFYTFKNRFGFVDNRLQEAGLWRTETSQQEVSYSSLVMSSWSLDKGGYGGDRQNGISIYFVRGTRRVGIDFN